MLIEHFDLCATDDYKPNHNALVYSHLVEQIQILRNTSQVTWNEDETKKIDELENKVIIALNKTENIWRKN